MLFNELDHRVARERINLSQVWQAWIEAEDLRRHSFLGTMAFEQRDIREKAVVGSTGSRSLAGAYFAKECPHSQFVVKMLPGTK